MLPELWLPHGDVAEPELSIVIPALNERIAIAEFVEWCKAGMARAGIVGEILIVDSSSDETAEIAAAHGARVLHTPKRGLGRAYIDAIPYIRGKYVLMGDADCTYDFRELAGFVEKFRQGYEFVMGSRFRGYIEPRAMPAFVRRAVPCLAFSSAWRRRLRATCRRRLIVPRGVSNSRLICFRERPLK